MRGKRGKGKAESGKRKAESGKRRCRTKSSVLLEQDIFGSGGGLALTPPSPPGPGEREQGRPRWSRANTCVPLNRPRQWRAHQRGRQRIAQLLSLAFDCFPLSPPARPKPPPTGLPASLAVCCSGSRCRSASARRRPGGEGRGEGEPTTRSENAAHAPLITWHSAPPAPASNFRSF